MIEFWRSVSGQYVTHWVQSLLDVWTADVFGFHAVQLGQRTIINGLQQNRCSNRWAIDLGEQAYGTQDDTQIMHMDVADYAYLPFESDSIDLLVMPFTLENHPDPHAVLREAYRVLRPEGKMILLGFNPLSIWGAQARWKRLRGQRWLPYEHEALNIHRAKDWLKLLNCEVIQGKYGCYAPMVDTQKWLDRYHWLEDAGDRWWGMAGAVYALMVTKKVYSPTLVGRIDDKVKSKRWAVQPALRESQPEVVLQAEDS